MRFSGNQHIGGRGSTFTTSPFASVADAAPAALASPWADYKRSSLQRRIDFFCSFFIIFFLLTAGPFGVVATLAFLAIGGTFVALRAPYALAAMANNLPLLIYPFVALLSVSWAIYPGEALRGGLQLLVTVIILLTMVYCVSFHQIVCAACIALLLLMVPSLFSSNTETIYQTGEVVRVGFFGSKNNLAMIASIAAAFGVAQVLISRRRLPLLMLGGLCSLVALQTFIQARSLGTTLSVIVLGLATSMLYLYSAAPLQKETKQVINTGIAVLLLSGLLALLVFFDYGAYEDLMYGLGKDPTITGRTLIWEVGAESIHEHPFLGVGLNSYWQLANPGALEIWEIGGKEPGTPFGFHNLYIHKMVELGLLGLIGVVWIYAGCIKAIFVRCSERLGPDELFAIFLFLILLSKSFFENAGFAPFNFSTFCIALMWVTLQRSSYDHLGKHVLIRI